MPANATHEQITWARNKLLDPEINITLLAAKFQRLKLALGLPESLMMQASRSYLDARRLRHSPTSATKNWIYPARVLSYMQDPELKG